MSDDIRLGIKKKSIKLSELEPDIALLASMFRRTTHTIVPKPEPIQPVDNDEEVSIALVARDIRLEREGGSPPTAELFSRHNVLQGLRIIPTRVSELRASYLKDLNAAADAGAKIVCFGEGAIPWEHENDYVAERVRRRPKPSPGDKRTLQGVKSRNKEFLDQIQSIATTRGLFVIAGSAHDQNCNNVGRVFWPGGSALGAHRKVQAALKLQEKLYPRTTPEFVIFESKDYYVVVLICVDAYSPETVLRCGLLAVKGADLVSQNRSSFWPRKPVRYIFVPSFNDRGSKLIWEACRELSQLCDTVVGYVNCQLQMPKFGLFASGYCVDNHKIDGVQNAIVNDIVTGSAMSSGAIYTISSTLRTRLQDRNLLKKDGVLRKAMAYAAADAIRISEA